MTPANITLYAQWAPIYSVTYNGNGNGSGAVPVDGTQYLSNQFVIVKGNTGALTKTGFTFIGWNTLANESGVFYVSNQIFTIGGANVTLYADWALTYTVTYTGNGSTGGNPPSDPILYTNGQTVTVLGNTGNLVMNSDKFTEWNTIGNGTGNAYQTGNTFAMGNTNVTLFAIWSNTNSFWGATNTIPVCPAADVLTIYFVNDTYGAFPDSQVYWSVPNFRANNTIAGRTITICPKRIREYISV